MSFNLRLSYTFKIIFLDFVTKIKLIQDCLLNLLDFFFLTLSFDKYLYEPLKVYFLSSSFTIFFKKRYCYYFKSDNLFLRVNKYI